MCAIREVLEETGFDITSRMQQHYAVRLTIKEQMITLYVVPNVPEDYPFETRTRKEISVCSDLYICSPCLIFSM
jgi:mRNA-decapping enzyme subunit 2